MNENVMRDFESIRSAIEKGQHFLITTHVNPDGDGIGSEIALYQYLKSIGKETHIINCSSMPDNFRFLVSDHEVEEFDEEKSTALFQEFDTAFVLDIGNYARLKEVGQLITFHNIPTVCIDHHPKEEDKFTHYYLDTTASATGELIYDLLTGLKAEITFSMAESIYSAIMADTGSFRFSNTSEKAHMIAAKLIGLGVNPERVWGFVNGDVPPERIALLSEAMSRIEYAADGKFAWCVINRNMLKRAGAQSKDIEGFADFLRNIKGVKASVVVLEISDEVTKLSFRSKEKFDSNDFARRLGGGGHKYASGARVTEGYKKLIPKMLAEAEQLMSDTYKNNS